MRAFYFSRDDKRLRYGDNRLCRTGTTHKVGGPPVLCTRGLHASERLLDALRYSPGSYLWLVKLGGEIVVGEDKAAATERTYLAGLNAGTILRDFARRQAAIHLEKIRPYTGNFDLIARWILTGDKTIRSAAESAARSAAWSAAESAAWSAAWSAARSAAWSAAESAAWSAAWSAAESAAWSAAESAVESAARSAARSAAWSAAESAAWSAAESAAWSAAESAVESAARSAARSAAWSAANDMLTEMVAAATGWSITNEGVTHVTK